MPPVLVLPVGQRLEPQPFVLVRPTARRHQPDSALHHHVCLGCGTSAEVARQLGQIRPWSPHACHAVRRGRLRPGSERGWVALLMHLSPSLAEWASGGDHWAWSRVGRPIHRATQWRWQRGWRLLRATPKRHRGGWEWCKQSIISIVRDAHMASFEGRCIRAWPRVTTDLLIQGVMTVATWL